MAEELVISLLRELAAFLLNEAADIIGVNLQPEIQFIRNELESMRAILRDVESQEDEILELRQWVNQVRELANDMEDFLDECRLRIYQHHRDPHQVDGFGGYFQKTYCSIKNSLSQASLSSEINLLKSRVIDISQRHKRFQSIGRNQQLSLRCNSGLIADVRASSVLVEEAELVGIQGQKSEILSRILAADDDSQSHRMRVVAVVGMGGLGKTTVVRKVYNDKTVKQRFEARAWITVSQSFQTSGIIKDLIRQMFDQIRVKVPPQVAESTNTLWLSSFARGFLQQRSYLVVLDDVWSPLLWDALTNVFPKFGNNNIHGGRVLLTTRIADVASAACFGSPQNYIHNMEALSEQDSWTLFCNRAFQGHQCPSHLEQVSRRILRKCHGLPLAISIIGGVLALKEHQIHQWEMVLHSLKGDQLDTTGKIARIRNVLLLSYQDLPHHLKHCFLYLAIYPEDKEIEVSDICRNWIGQGLIQKREGILSYDIANLYVQDLANRHLLQVTEKFHDGSLRRCKVHDLLRDIIVAKSRDCNILTIVERRYNEPQTSDRLRRLVIHDYNDPEIGSPRQQLNHGFKSLRTLEFQGDTSRVTSPVVSKFLQCGIKLLKVLNLQRAPLEDIPEEVFSLFHLENLCLELTRVRTIPKSIGKLRNLEILDLYGTQVAELPEEVFKLTKLSTLYLCDEFGYPSHISNRGFKCPPGIENLVHLEWLLAIEADENGQIVREIGRLTQLQRLTITNLRREDGKEFIGSLVKLTKLDHLVVFPVENETLDLQYPMSPMPQLLKWVTFGGHIDRIPQWVKSLQSLTKLVFVESGLKEDEAGAGGLEFLQDLPNLKLLQLYRAYEGERLIFRHGGFQKLKELSLVRLNRLKLVMVEDDESLPSLEILNMVKCNQVMELPCGTANLKKLKSLSLMNMSDGFVKKMLNLDPQSEEYQPIAHVPEVRIQYWSNGEWSTFYLPARFVKA